MVASQEGSSFMNYLNVWCKIQKYVKYDEHFTTVNSYRIERRYNKHLLNTIFNKNL